MRNLVVVFLVALALSVAGQARADDGGTLDELASQQRADWTWFTMPAKRLIDWGWGNHTHWQNGAPRGRMVQAQVDRSMNARPSGKTAQQGPAKPAPKE